MRGTSLQDLATSSSSSSPSPCSPCIMLEEATSSTQATSEVLAGSLERLKRPRCHRVQATSSSGIIS
jgi:hypothetical protein